MEHTTADHLPTIGDRVTVHGIACRVTAIHPLGTIDATAIDGSRAYRITGLYRPGWPLSTIREGGTDRC